MNFKENQLFLLLAAIPLIVLFIMRCTGFDGLFGQDSYEYLRYTKSLAAFINGGPYPGDLAWPKGYLFLTGLLSLVLDPSLSGQLLSFFFFYGSGYFLYKMIVSVYQDHRHAHFYLIVSFLLSPYLLRLGNIMMADSLAVFTVIGAAYYAFEYEKKGSLKTLLLCCLLVSYGMISRYAVIVPMTPIVFWTIVCWSKQQKWRHLVVLFIPLFFLSIHIYFEGNGSTFLEHHFIKKWSLSNLFRSKFNLGSELQLPLVSYNFPNLIYYLAWYFHPGFFFLSFVLLIISLKRIRAYLRIYPRFIIASIILYSVFLSGITFQSSRYLALTYPLFCLLIFPLFRDFIQRIQSFKKVIIICLVIIQLALFYKALMPTFQMNKLERSMTDKLREFEQETLYSFAVDISLQARGLNFNYRNLWEKQYDDFEKGALVLFNEEKFEELWKGRNVMINWYELKKQYQLDRIRTFEGGWELYRIE